jgi:hypothetical protein
MQAVGRFFGEREQVIKRLWDYVFHFIFFYVRSFPALGFLTFYNGIQLAGRKSHVRRVRKKAKALPTFGKLKRADEPAKNV